MRGACPRFLRATALQCLQSGLPGAPALQQHVLRLLSTGIHISRCLADPEVRICRLHQCIATADRCTCTITEGVSCHS